MRKIKKVSNYTKAIKLNSKFRIIINVDENTKNIIEKMGFSKDNCCGIPKLINGKKTLEENINGVMSINKNEYEPYYRYFHWHNVDWNGKEHSGIATIVAERYKREYSLPLCLEFYLIEKDNELFFCSDVLINSDTYEEIILAYMNMFKDLFGAFVVSDEDLNIHAKIQRVNWEVLKPGKIDDYVRNISGRVKNTDNVVKSHERLINALIKNYNPTEYIGCQGFQGYVVFVYDDRDFVVLENIIYGNATYILSKANWEEISQMSKQDVLQKKLYEKKIIHNSSWLFEINRLFNDN